MLYCVESEAQTCASINFSTSIKIGCSPLVVKFTAKGAPMGSTYTWDFGGGSVTGVDTIYKAFTVPGKYTITLKVTTPTGTVCTIVKTDSVTVLPTPAPDIKVEPGKQVCTGPQDVKFTDNTPDIIEREWIIDGVSYKDVTTVTHKFTSTGFKSLSLKVKNKAGCVGLLSENKFINITDSVLTEFCGDIIITDKDIQATFSPNVAIAAPRSIKTYEWTFPGGTPSSFTGKTPPTVKYKLSSIPHDVKLVVTTNEGCKYTALRKSFIQHYIQASTDSLCMGKSVSISNKAINNGRGYFEWVILDAEIVGEPKPEGISVKYSSAGKFNMKMNFKYSQFGCKSSVSYPAYINSLGPKVGFESPQQAVCDPNAKINLINKSNEFGATNVMYTWRLYDSLDKPIPGKVFGPTKAKDAFFYIKEFGRFGVSLSAKSSNGCTDSVYAGKFITIANPTIVSIETDTPSYCLGQTVTLYSNPYPTDEKGDAYKYIWNIQHSKISNLFFTVLGSTASWLPTYPGEYHVTHIIENGAGCGDTVTKKSFIKSVGALATITLDQTTGCAGMGTRAVAKILDKYPNTPNNIVKYQWAVDPSDGVNIINDKSQIAYIQFWESGTFDIILNIIDQEGCTTQVVEDDLVKLGVTSGFTMPRNKCLGDTLDVSVYASADAETYKWTLTPSDAGIIYPSDTVRDVRVIYNKDTCYTLQLVTSKTVAGRLCTDTTSYTKCVVLPTAGFSTTDTALYCAPAVANFISESTNAKKYLWEFGDGTSLMNESEKISHVYLQNSMQGFNVKITAFDSNGCSESFTGNNLVKIVGPEPKFTIDRNIGCDNTLIKFTNTSKNIKNFVLIYDDGTVLDSNSVEDHLYSLENNGMDSMIFYPILLAIDNANCKAFHKDTIVIYRSPVASFYSDTLNACVPYNAGFKNTSMRAKAWWWDFENDGIVDDSTENPRHIYTEPGLYSVKLKIRNNGGCFDSVIMQNYINVEAIPVGQFSSSKNKFCNKADINFTDSSKFYDYYLFNYGDGSALETSTMPRHNYAFREGIDKGDSIIFYPQQIVYNSAGCTDTFTDTIIVYANPVSGYTESILSGCSPLTVEFTDTSKHSALTEWDFDNNGVTDATGAKVQHVFTTGLYTVKQKNTSGFGCTDSFIKVNRIKVNEPPGAGFAVSDSVICYGETVQFTDLSTPQSNLRKWEWYFDEKEVKSDSSNIQHPKFQFFTAGFHTIKLKVQDDEGCWDSIMKKAVFVEDTLEPVNSKILFVSVNADGKVAVVWNKNTVYDFTEYRLQRSDNLPSIIHTAK
ncbi:MAG: PKD domain-containing protein, partial [Bacteroidia bacterium]